MKKLSFACAMVILSAGAAVQAQKQSGVPKRLPPPIIQLDNIIIEDDASGNFLIIAPNSGEYKFHRCSDGLSISGFGVLKLDGCAVSFEDNQADHRVLASINLCAQEGKAIVERFAPALNTFAADAVKEILIDKSLRDNTLSCAPKK